MLQYFPFTPLSEGTFVHAALYFLFSIDRSLLRNTAIDTTLNMDFFDNGKSFLLKTI